jgi:hypothetical protein
VDEPPVAEPGVLPCSDEVVTGIPLGRLGVDLPLVSLSEQARLVAVLINLNN